MHPISIAELKAARDNARLTPAQAAQACGLHRTTYARMERGQTRVSPPAYQLLLSRSQLPGDWRGWSLSDTALWSTSGRAYTPGELESVVLLYQRLSALEQALERAESPRLT